MAAASYHDAGFIRMQNFAGLTGGFGDFGTPNLEQLGPGVGGQTDMGKGAGPGGESADAVPKNLRGLAPIQQAVRLGNFASVAGAFGGLRTGNDFSSDVILDSWDKKCGAEFCETVVQGLRIILGLDGGCLLREDVAGVEAGVHFHDGDAGFGFAVQDGPLDGGGAAIFGEERG